ncbi:GNAT family N-acetyltransferase [Candidatus Saccharibacteria bacterium oral taxon 488]|nr:GNAT family N-acetyltransferase [Candidatus Saccharibacteria bacterium oral taxon 488]
MKFKHGTRRRAAEYEKDWVQRWKDDQTFEKSVTQRPADNAYVFYDGPPFITGVPHHGTLLSSIVKDAVPRYHTMKGKRVERRWGWDCHGLPAENFVEKQMNIVDRRQIVTSSVKRVKLVNDFDNATKVITKVAGWMGQRGYGSSSWDVNNLTPDKLAEEFGRDNFYVAYDDDKLVGSVVISDKDSYNFFAGKKDKGTSVGYLYKMAVLPEFQKQGYANAMLKEAVRLSKQEGVKEIRIEVGEHQPKLVNLYERNGFQRVGEHISTETGVNWLLYSLEVSSYPDAVYNQLAPLDKDGNPLPTISLEKYITKARESMVANSETWQGVIDRIGRWVDFAGAYRTMDKNFMESVWWAFKQLYEAGKIYEGEKVLMYDTKFATPVSKAEVTMDNDAYQTVTDPSVYVKFKLDDEDAAVLAWTTTPWTLPANLMLAVNPEMTYCEVKVPKGTKNVFLLSGKHAYASREYYPQLKQQLEQQGYAVTIIDHVNPDSPDLAENVERLAQYDFANAHVVTHSLGAATFLKYLQDANVTVASLTMIAPAYGVSNSSDEQWKQESGYVGLAVDLAQVRRKIDRRPTIVYSDDAEVLNQGFAQLGTELDAVMQHEPGKGHFFATEKSLAPEITLPLSEKFILAEEALERTLQDEKHQSLDYDVLRTFPGSELVGKKYQPLDTGSTWPENDKIHTIYAADFVSHESGTGIVHIAPAYGEDDFELAKRHGISAFHVIDDNGYYTDTNYKGLEVWDNNKFIAKDLKEKGVVWKIEYIRHEYPFNPRSKQRIMYRAIPSWFFDIQGQKPLMLEQNENINWFPHHLKHGRFAKNIEQAPDWNLSRDRFWATAMPVWKGDQGTVKVVGSYAELKELSGVELEDYHRPWVDDITFTIEGETFTRIDKVLDCWFESGSMPFAQLHYPFENQAKFEQNYPADFIVEYIGQVRAWFYYVHAVNVALAEIGAFCEAGEQHKNAYSNVITTGVVAGNDGRKMSKSLGNFTDPNELMDKFSADSLRFLLLSSPLLNGEDFALHDKDVGDVARKLSMIWNMYDFFTMYAEVDGWEFDGEMKDPLSELTNPLDIWIVSRLHQLVAEVERHMDTYNIPDALSPILPLLDDASNWYVRRSRRRFWKSEDDGDKNDAYRTLHYVLVRLSYLLAPFTPFLAEELYHNLTGDDESIHLKDWLPAGEVNEQVLADMSRTRELINNGLSLRMKQDEHQASIKVRQPLQFAAYAGAKLAEYYEQIMAEELNVKEIRWIENLDEHLADYDVTEGAIKPESWIEISKHLTPELKREGLMREVIRHVQSARKKAGLQVDDRIMLQLTTSDEQLRQATDEHAEAIATETLAVFGEVHDNQSTVTVEGAELEIALVVVK